MIRRTITALVVAFALAATAAPAQAYVRPAPQPATAAAPAPTLAGPWYRYHYCTKTTSDWRVMVRYVARYHYRVTKTLHRPNGTTTWVLTRFSTARCGQ